jgi:hypothetical protein
MWRRLPVGALVALVCLCASGWAVSAAMGAPAGAPVNVSPPAITGIAQQGQTLTAKSGSWTNSPTRLEFQWMQCDASGTGCSAIAGATGQTYVAVAGDVGHALSLTETATDAEGSASATAGATRPIAPPAEWRLEQPEPPPPPPGVQRAPHPVGLGKIGDIEFVRPNLGLLITAGNPPTVPPGVWGYDGVSWRPLTGEGPGDKGICGASDGRIAWAFAGLNGAGEEEFDFWTVSDGRAGQITEHGAPLADNTLCHFKGSVREPGAVVKSYGSPAFTANSYQAMHAAGCISQNDCWFAGDLLPAGNQFAPGSFHLHWNGSEVAETPNPQGHVVEDMRAFELQAPPREVSGTLPPRYLFESVLRVAGDGVHEPESPASPSLVHLITPIGAQPTFLSLTPGVPLYGENELPASLGFFHLGADESALWGAADPVSTGNPEGAEVTVVRVTSAASWSQVLGPNSDPLSGNPFTKYPEPKSSQEERENEDVSAIAPDHFGESAWLALTSRENAAKGSAAPALLARVSAGGSVAERVSLPSSAEAQRGVRPKGAADKLTCPALNDCWLATREGWLFHLTGGQALERNSSFDEAFPSPINFRPLDEGVPQVQPDQPPPEEAAPPQPPPIESLPEAISTLAQTSVAVALLSHVRTRLVHGTTLELRFHLAVRARVRLIAKRKARVVASTAMRTFGAGNRRLLLRLNVKRWPTKLDLQTHALEALPTVSLRGAATTTVGTGLNVLPKTPPFSGPGLLP